MKRSLQIGRLAINLSWKIGLVLLFISVVADFSVKRMTASSMYYSIDQLPKTKVGLLLGTSKYVRKGRLNLYYSYRIDAAVELFNAGKIDYILVSGDNSTINYDEPTTMRNDLIERGIPADRIFLDYAGFRTLDSVVRAKEIFGQTRLTIISQRFHNERAVVLASHFGIEAYGFCARDVKFKGGFKTKVRELMARNKLFLDLMFGKQPKFLGERIDIN
jgi:SanA protein